MQTLSLASMRPARPNKGEQSRRKFIADGISLDKLIIFGILIGANLHLFNESFGPALVFFPASFKAGAWWQIVTHPFAHITWYHLLLDGSAFFLLYGGLEEKRFSRKILYVLICAASSLTLALLAAPLVYTKGLCGLSGIDHGLMAVSALEMMRSKAQAKWGVLGFFLVVAKSTYEAINGEVLFAFMHLGLCGIPLAACHAGGVIGGCIGFFLMERYGRWEKSKTQ